MIFFFASKVRTTHSFNKYFKKLQIERHVFEATMNRLNEYFAEAEKGSCSTYCEGCLACITAYLVYMCSETHYEKVCFILKFIDHLLITFSIF